MPPCFLFFFLFFKGIRGTLRGKNNCAQHRSKGTTLDTDKGKQHPRGFAKAQRAREECSSVRSLGIFSSTQSAHDSNQQNKNCNTVHRKKTKKSHQSLRPETSGSMTTATVQIFSSFYLFMLHMTLVFSLYKYVFFLSKWLMPLSSQGQWRKVSALSDMHQ